MQWAGATAAVLMAVTSMSTSASAQSLRDFGQADGWQVKQLDDDACVMMKYLGGTEDSTLVFYRFEPGDAVEMNVSILTAMAVPDRNAVDWGALEPLPLYYAVSSGGTFGQTYEVEGYLGHEYVDPSHIRQIFTIDLDAPALDRIAGADVVGLATDAEHAERFPLGRATRAVAIARRCERQLRR